MTPREAPRAISPRVSRADAAQRKEAIDNADGDAESVAKRAPAPGMQFGALLSLLAETDTVARNTSSDQLSGDAAALLDHLLQDGVSLQRNDGETPDVIPVAARLGRKVSKIPDPDIDRLLHNNTLRIMTGEVGTTHSVAASSAENHSDATRRAIMLDVLSRLSSRRQTSREQLLAIGDGNGADARAMLDALLAQAGTPAGARIAAQAISRSIYGGLPDTMAGQSSEGHASADVSVGSDPQTTAVGTTSMVASAGAMDVRTPLRSVDTIDPELRMRMERVIERMKSEYGHDVTIVETVRSQDRQDWLFAQGRDRDGPIVTWTRESAHTRGEAVDVLIDGDYENDKAFARLQQIAREEGLRTLGLKDPGHLELPRTDARYRSTDTSDARWDDPEGAAGVARVAGIAAIGSIAQVASTSAASPTASPGNNAAVSAIFSQHGNLSSHNSSTGRRDSKSERQEAPSRDGHGLNGTPINSTSAFTALSSASGSVSNMSGGATGADGMERASGTASGNNQAERIFDIQTMRANAPAGPLARMTLNLDHATGTQERITIDLRGNTVSTHISTDTSTASDLRLRTAQLQDALGRHGLEGDTVRISGARNDTVESLRIAGADQDRLRTLIATPISDSAGSTAGRERSFAREWQHQQESSHREQASQTDERQEHQGRRRRPDSFTAEKK